MERKLQQEVDQHQHELVALQDAHSSKLGQLKRAHKQEVQQLKQEIEKHKEQKGKKGYELCKMKENLLIETWTASHLV